jgi:phage terminase large subunit
VRGFFLRSGDKPWPRLTKQDEGEVEEGINAARILLPKCWFDAERCKPGLEALAHYRRDFNQRLNEFKATPVHDWSSHGAASGGASGRDV